MHVEELAWLEVSVLTHFDADTIGCSVQRRLHGMIQPPDLLRGQLRAPAIRVNHRCPQDFVGIRVADAGDEFTPHQIFPDPTPMIVVRSSRLLRPVTILLVSFC